MADVLKFLVTVDAKTGATLKIERIGPKGELTDVPLSVFTLSPSTPSGEPAHALVVLGAPQDGSGRISVGMGPTPMGPTPASAPPPEPETGMGPTPAPAPPPEPEIGMGPTPAPAPPPEPEIGMGPTPAPAPPPEPEPTRTPVPTPEKPEPEKGG